MYYYLNQKDGNGTGRMGHTNQFSTQLFFHFIYMHNQYPFSDGFCSRGRTANGWRVWIAGAIPTTRTHTHKQSDRGPSRYLFTGSGVAQWPDATDET